MTQSGHKRVAFAAMHGPDVLYLARDPWPWGTPHAAARLHHPVRWLGSMAARGARSSRRAGDRVLGCCYACGCEPMARRFCAATGFAQCSAIRRYVYFSGNVKPARAADALIQIKRAAGAPRCDGRCPGKWILSFRSLDGDEIVDDRLDVLGIDRRLVSRAHLLDLGVPLLLR